jgi:ABC-2 type transport system permease protein
VPPIASRWSISPGASAASRQSEASPWRSQRARHSACSTSASGGAITRLRIAPIPRAAILGGKLLARFLVGLGQLLLLFLYGHVAFGLSLGSAPVALGLVMAAVVFSMTGFSLLVSVFARTREQVIPLGLTAWAMEGFHDVILRDRGLLDVLPGIGVLVAYGTVCLAGGARLYRLDAQ